MTEIESSSCPMGGLKYISNVLGTWLSILNAVASHWHIAHINLPPIATNHSRQLGHTVLLDTVFAEKVSTGSKGKH
ncbi:hypothetical protein PSACC_02314 [Paramicrosporidium saccamoebae]|uniref:Uncharacterized protein n=1 Tax=Paramicrosporidium saccamoebae TaxID=1246581 RepID=A0A2H9TJE4_9FUNG|nr:hypothetical protein PSACC_02314 [Paramicrosporidium saccamoebae]